MACVYLIETGYPDISLPTDTDSEAFQLAELLQDVYIFAIYPVLLEYHIYYCSYSLWNLHILFIGGLLLCAPQMAREGSLFHYNAEHHDAAASGYHDTDLSGLQVYGLDRHIQTSYCARILRKCILNLPFEAVLHDHTMGIG